MTQNESARTHLPMSGCSNLEQAGGHGPDLSPLAALHQRCVEEVLPDVMPSFGWLKAGVGSGCASGGTS